MKQAINYFGSRLKESTNEPLVNQFLNLYNVNQRIDYMVERTVTFLSLCRRQSAIARRNSLTLTVVILLLADLGRTGLEIENITQIDTNHIYKQQKYCLTGNGKNIADQV
jgi:hypothetical protein